MPIATTRNQSTPARWSRGCLLLALLTSIASLSALVFYYQRGAILLYGDGVAHINIARRVFDSRTPGLFQLGTVWLPLPHLLDIPFVWNDWLWRTGLGASIPSMLAYIAGTIGVFRLVRGLASRTAAWIAALIFAFNPNLLYMQATAMTESLYLALFLWIVVFFAEFAREAAGQLERAGKSMRNCALTLAVAMLVRYDAWFLAAFVAAGAFLVLRRASQASSLTNPQCGQDSNAMRTVSQTTAGLIRPVVGLAVLAGLTGGLWLAYNHAHWGNSIEFANGPYSARAIQQQTRTPTMPTYPGENSPPTAALYFLKLCRFNLGEGPAGQLLFATALVALLWAIFFARRITPWMLLWVPLPFYVLSIAWGSVPVYFPDWWPYSYYNVRYGLQLLPAVAVFVALACEVLSRLAPARIVTIVVALIVAASYTSLWRRTPICLREAEANGAARLQFDQRLAAELKRLPPRSTLMMDCGAHSGAVQAAGIPFRRVLRESNPPYWETALTQPSRSADYVIAIDGDDVARAVKLFPQGLEPVATVGAPGRARAVIYKTAGK